MRARWAEKKAWGIAWFALFWGACLGSEGSPQGPHSGGSGGRGASPSETGGATGASSGPSSSGGSPSSTSGMGAAACGPRLPARLTLLSDYQHLNSLRAVLGPSAVSAEDASENTAQTKPFTQKGVVVNTSLVHQRSAWAQTASATLGSRFMEVTACDPNKPDDACAERFLRKFAARAFRRPIEEEEASDLLTVYQAGKMSSFTSGIQRAVEAVLSAPSFMYRRELGKADAQGNLNLTPHELASELSYLLTDQPPDADLLAAAEAGTLGDKGELERQVARLIAKPEVQATLNGTLIASWGLSNLFGTAKDPKLFPEYTPQLQAGMFHETELFLQSVLWDGSAEVSELLRSSKGFVNKPLAAVYGVPFTGQADSFTPATLPKERAGLLTEAGVLATLARTDTTSVVARGLFVRNLLCLPKLPGPPESLAGAVQDLLKADMTERERADVRKMNPTCAGCHAGIDPFGLLLESYDPLGKFRTTLNGKSIETSTEVNAGASLSGTFADAVAFSKAAAETPLLATCVGTRLLSYAIQDDSVQANDCEVSALFANAPAKTATMRQLITAVATSPALRVRRKEQP